jgi:hypothetical protein
MAKSGLTKKPKNTVSTSKPREVTGRIPSVPSAGASTVLQGMPNFFP